MERLSADQSSPSAIHFRLATGGGFRSSAGLILDGKCPFDDYRIMEEQDAVGALAALAQESRLAIYRLLVKRGPEGFTPGEISEHLGIPGPTLSFHLKGLAHAGLVSVRRESRFMHYSASFERMNELVAYLTENCCSLGTTCDVACAPITTNVGRRRRA
jgi:DNA-binding transcriptional ArsR family regulator